VTPPKDFDDTGFKVVGEGKRKKETQNTGEKKYLSKQEFINQQTLTQKPKPKTQGEQGTYNKPPPQYQNRSGSPTSGYKTRGSKLPKTNKGRVEDVNDKNLNRPDFPIRKQQFGEDKPPRKTGDNYS